MTRLTVVSRWGQGSPVHCVNYRPFTLNTLGVGSIRTLCMLAICNGCTDCSPKNILFIKIFQFKLKLWRRIPCWILLYWMIPLHFLKLWVFKLFSIEYNLIFNMICITVINLKYFVHYWYMYCLFQRFCNRWSKEDQIYFTFAFGSICIKARATTGADFRLVTLPTTREHPRPFYQLE